jgi:putative two-component system response regulator
MTDNTFDRAQVNDRGSKGLVLAVDDTPASLKLLVDILTSEGYEVRPAITGELAVHAAEREPPDLVLLDVNMPGMNGFEVCTRIKLNPLTSSVPVIFVSALSESEEILKGFGYGAVDYVTKPFRREELLARVHTHLELNRLRHHQEAIVEERTRSLRKSEEMLKETLIDSVTAIAAIVELRDPYTAGHQRRVARLASAIAVELGWPDEKIIGVNLAGAVHDVGKIRVPAEILSKPGRLSEIEFSMIQQHSQTGYEILKEIKFPWPIEQFVLQHHERLDGSGYPHGLRGDEILPETRILSVADVLEAMASHRPYRPGFGIESTLRELEGKRGTLFDPDVVDATLLLFREKGYQTEFLNIPAEAPSCFARETQVDSEEYGR